jgi:hypothetical protein
VVFWSERVHKWDEPGSGLSRVYQESARVVGQRARRWRVLDIRHGEDVSFNNFATQLIRKTKLTWTAPNAQFADIALRGSIKWMVIYVLEGFNALKCQYKKEPLGKGTITELEAIQVTPWGRTLLDAVGIMGDR